jgi:hypothetical protein
LIDAASFNETTHIIVSSGLARIMQNNVERKRFDLHYQNNRIMKRNPSSDNIDKFTEFLWVPASHIK